MSDLLIIDGDSVNFLPAFGMATVIPQPGKITASGGATLSGKKVCIEGDEKSVSVPGCMYMTAQHSIPGTGTLLIAQLAGEQVAKKTKSTDKPVILKGIHFTAKFQVQQPAMQPPPGPGPPIPDATPEYGNGKGMFVPANTKLKGT